MTSALHTHRHQHVERAGIARVLHHRRRLAVGETEFDLILNLIGDVVQISGLEANLQRPSVVLDVIRIQFFGRRPLLRAGGREDQQVPLTGAPATAR